MHWDFYTLLSVFSGIVLIAGSLAGPSWARRGND